MPRSCVRLYYAVQVLSADTARHCHTSTTEHRRELHQRRDNWLSQLFIQPQQNQPLHWHKTVAGKPFLADFEHIACNQSHTQHFFALVANDRALPCGIDIEQKNRPLRLPLMAATLTAREHQIFSRCAKQPLYWLKCWVIKEAALKAAGCGLSLALDSIDSQADLSNSRGHISLKHAGNWQYQLINNDRTLTAIAWPAAQYAVVTQTPATSLANKQ